MMRGHRKGCELDVLDIEGDVQYIRLPCRYVVAQGKWKAEPDQHGA